MLATTGHSAGGSGEAGGWGHSERRGGHGVSRPQQSRRRGHKEERARTLSRLGIATHAAQGSALQPNADAALGQLLAHLRAAGGDGGDVEGLPPLLLDPLEGEGVCRVGGGWRRAGGGATYVWKLTDRWNVCLSKQAVRRHAPPDLPPRLQSSA